jgi:choloylglycine hydrolase
MYKYLPYLFFLILLLKTPVNGCTDFCLKDQKNNIVVGRSLEFAQNLESQIVIYPKNQKLTSIVKVDGKNQKGLSWTSRYNFLAINAFDSDLLIDGFNEKGLSIGTLWFPGAKYPEFKPDKRRYYNAISLIDLGLYLLGSYSSVDEVKRALKRIDIYFPYVKQLGQIPPIHLSIHDKSGASIVVEFIDHKMIIHDNKIGVLTNMPSFDWQVTNLANYINLSDINKKSIKLDGGVLNPTGQGSGLLGIPGDWTPPSRFVRIALIKNFVQKAKNVHENINLGFHLLNMVDIPYGAVRDSQNKGFDYTQWSLVKDLKNGVMYYRTYYDQRVKTIDLNMEAKNLKSTEKKIPMVGVTDSLIIKNN